MSSIQVDRNNGYLYQQIYQIFKEKISRKNLNEHDKLPSKRELAKLLNVSINTVSSAYEQLLSEGYIYTIERVGYFVENITYYKNNSKEVVRKN